MFRKWLAVALMVLSTFASAEKLSPELELSLASGYSLHGLTKDNTPVYRVDRKVSVADAMNRIVATGWAAGVPLVLFGNDAHFYVAVKTKSNEQVAMDERKWNDLRVKLYPELAFLVMADTRFQGVTVEGGIVVAEPERTGEGAALAKMIATGRLMRMPKIVQTAGGWLLVEVKVKP